MKDNIRNLNQLTLYKRSCSSSEQKYYKITQVLTSLFEKESFSNEKKIRIIFTVELLLRARNIKVNLRHTEEMVLNKAFRHVKTLFIRGRNLVPRRLAIGWRSIVC